MQFNMFKVICLTSNFQMIENLPPGNDKIRPYSVKKLDEQQILYENNKRLSATQSFETRVLLNLSYLIIDILKYIILFWDIILVLLYIRSIYGLMYCIILWKLKLERNRSMINRMNNRNNYMVDMKFTIDMIR